MNRKPSAPTTAKKFNTYRSASGGQACHRQAGLPTSCRFADHKEMLIGQLAGVDGEFVRARLTVHPEAGSRAITTSSFRSHHH